jgi:hypothetical protein
MKITKRQLKRLIREVGEAAWEKKRDTPGRASVEELELAVDLEPDNPDRPDEALQYVKNLDDGDLYRLPANVAKAIDTAKRDPWKKKKLMDDAGQWTNVSDLLGTPNWEWSGAQGSEYGALNAQRSSKQKTASSAPSAAPSAPTGAVVSGKVEVEWDLADTEFADMSYDQAVKSAGLPAQVDVPEMEEDELTDWLSDEYGYTHLGWNPVNEGRKMKITKRQLRRIIREALSRDAQDLEPRLVAVWEQVSADTLQALGGQASWEEIGEEVMASGYTIDPDLIESINLLPFEEQQKLFQKTFGAGRRY